MAVQVDVLPRAGFGRITGSRGRHDGGAGHPHVTTVAQGQNWWTESCAWTARIQDRQATGNTVAIPGGPTPNRAGSGTFLAGTRSRTTTKPGESSAPVDTSGMLQGVISGPRTTPAGPEVGEKPMDRYPTKSTLRCLTAMFWCSKRDLVRTRMLKRWRRLTRIPW